MERLTAFEETIRDLERDEFKAKRQKRRRIERRNREAYIDLLEKLQKERKVTLYSRWADTVKSHLMHLDEYIHLSG